MTNSRIERIRFTDDDIRVFADTDARHKNWPVVYLLDGTQDVYVGETLDTASRMKQHLGNPHKQGFTGVRVVLNEKFNKSVCLDLESFLINALNGDGRLTVTNLNAGIVDRDYYDRASYRESFLEIFEQLRGLGVFERRIEQIENDDLFKLSPFKALTTDQAVAMEGILEGLFDDVDNDASRTIVVQGDPGTGKTIVGISLVKLLQDMKSSDREDAYDSDALFSDFFALGYAERIKDYRIGLVVPQQSLRASIKQVFKKTPSLSANMVLSPFDVAKVAEPYDVLIVDEAHRLSRRANQSSAMLNKQFREANERLFGHDDTELTQLDWVRDRSRHQILLLDTAQRIKPADLSSAILDELITSTKTNNRFYPLASQMRVLAGEDYILYIRQILKGEQSESVTFRDYDLRMFDDLAEMHEEIRERDAEVGLARLIAGYAWEWKSKTVKTDFDIEIDEVQLRWNQTDKDWINSKTSLEEVGSIHTVQGYDLNFAGVIIGPDLKFDPVGQRIYVDRDSYFDKKGKENNPKLGIVFSDDDLQEFIAGIYFVLLTRGMRGTYVHVVDPELREYMRQFFPARPR
ncbi:MAG: DNA/RNA helicase domain-containing protein [Rhodoglobus sp.]